MNQIVMTMLDPDGFIS